MRDPTTKYILDGHRAVPEDDVIKWATWFKKGDRVVAKSRVGGWEVSTVFLGLDHQFGHGPPLLFETMVFPECEICERTATWEAAEAMHAKIVAELESKP